MTDPNGQAKIGNWVPPVARAENDSLPNFDVPSTNGGGDTSNPPVRTSPDDENENFSSTSTETPAPGQSSENDTDAMNVSTLETAVNGARTVPGTTAAEAITRSANRGVEQPDTNGPSNNISGPGSTKPWAEALKPSRFVGTSKVTNLTDADYYKMTLTEARASYGWIGFLQTQDVSTNKAFPFLAYLTNRFRYWTMEQALWMGNNLTPEEIRQVKFERTVALYFKNVAFNGRARAFEFFRKMGRTEAVKLIKLKSVEEDGEVVLKEALGHGFSNLSINESMQGISNWIQQTLSAKTAALQELGNSIAAISNEVAARCKEKGLNDFPQGSMATILTAEEIAILRQSLYTRLEIWILAKGTLRFCEETQMAHVYHPTWHPIDDPCYPDSPLMNLPELVHGYVNDKSSAFKRNDHQRAVFENLLSSISFKDVNGFPRQFEAMKHASEFLPFTLRMEVCDAPRVLQTMQAHCEKFPTTPEYFFTGHHVDQKSKDNMIYKGCIRLCDGRVPAIMVDNNLSHPSHLKIDEYTRYCSHCFLTDHVSYNCPSSFCSYCNTLGHWTRRCDKKKRHQRDQGSRSDEQNKASEIQSKMSEPEHTAPKQKRYQQSLPDSEGFQQVGPASTAGSPKKQSIIRPTSKSGIVNNPYQILLNEKPVDEAPTVLDSGFKTTSLKPANATNVITSKHSSTIVHNNTTTKEPSTMASHKVHSTATEKDPNEGREKDKMTISFAAEDVANSTFMELNEEDVQVLEDVQGPLQGLDTTMGIEDGEGGTLRAAETTTSMTGEGSVIYDDSSDDEDLDDFERLFDEVDDERLKENGFSMNTKTGGRVTRNTSKESITPDYRGVRYALAFTNPETGIYEDSTFTANFVENHKRTWIAMPENYRSACQDRGWKKAMKIAARRARASQSEASIDLDPHTEPHNLNL